MRTSRPKSIALVSVWVSILVAGSTHLATACDPNHPVPSPWVDANIGGVAGCADQVSGVFTITSNGGGTSSSDRLNFVYQTYTGNFVLTARALSRRTWCGVRAHGFIPR
ncbi:MAG: hypothetical protein HY049_11410 [Acidobacteria bacterium]|nr:hypothetical protein [Acidobacteriota bacterium]